MLPYHKVCCTTRLFPLRHPAAMSSALALTCLLILHLPAIVRASAWTTCQNVCGDIPVSYPFGTGHGCGSPAFERYVNCTKGKLQLYTPTGQYAIRSIDYTNNVLIIQDPTMSTCSYMQRSNSFGLPLGAPFSIVTSDKFVLLNCASTSSVYNALSTVCDPTGTTICQTLYGCPSITQLGLAQGGPTSSCCVYASSQFNNPPYEINLALLQCASYTSVYDFGLQGVSPNSYQNPNLWSFGIALKFYYDQSASYASCRACQQSNGVCAFNVYGFVCVCSAGLNTTTQCYGGSASLVNIGTRVLQNRIMACKGAGMAGVLLVLILLL